MVKKFKVSELGGFKREELYQIAQELEIKGRSKMSKAQLIEALAAFALPEAPQEDVLNKSSVAKTPAKKTAEKSARTQEKTPDKSTVSHTRKPGRPAGIKIDTREIKAPEKKDKPAKPAKPSTKKPLTQKKKEAVADLPGIQPEAKGAAENILARSFAKEKKSEPLYQKQGAVVQSVAIPVEIPVDLKPEPLSPKAQQIEQERSKRHASLKTTMEIPVFSAPEPEVARPVSENDLTGDLPADYGETRIVVQVRDPHWAHAYWQIPRSELKKLEMHVGIFEFAHSHFSLRVHNVTDGFTQEFALGENTRSYYFYLEKANTVYQAELGLQSPTEGYTFIALSNLVQTPPDKVASTWATPVKPVAANCDEERIAGHEIPSPIAEVKPPVPEITEPNQVFSSSLSGGSVPAALDFVTESGAPDQPESVGEAPVLPVLNSDRPSSENLISSWAVPNPVSSTGRNSEVARDTDIYLTLNPELIVYGSVDSRCRLSFNHHQIMPDKDGTYSLRLELPLNQSREIEVEAVDPETGKTRMIRARVKFELI